MKKTDAEDTYLKSYGPGESFGELALLYNAPRAVILIFLFKFIPIGYYKIKRIGNLFFIRQRMFQSYCKRWFYKKKRKI